MTERSRGVAEMVAAMSISGTIGWFVVVSGRPVADVVFWRCLFGGLTLVVVCGTKGLLHRKALSLREAGLAVAGGVAIVVNWLMLFAAYPRASISLATAVYNTQPFMLAGLGVIVFAERLSAAKVAWLAIAFAGTLAIIQAKPDAAAGGADYLVGIALALGAAFAYALAAIIAKSLKGVPPHLIALVQVTVGVLMLAPFAATSTLPPDRGSWAALVTIGVLHTGVMYILLYGAIQKLPTSLTGALSFIYPVIAVAVDAVAFGRTLQGLQAVGAAAILLAAAGMVLGWDPAGGAVRLLGRQGAGLKR
jgi:drug/metabolite transporter (DMT)-like permease